MSPQPHGARDDLDLVRAWRRGDPQAGEALIERHAPFIWRFFRRKIDVDAEDLTQKTFLACLELQDRLRPDASFRAFALGVARNLWLRHRRALSRGREEERSAIEAVPLVTPSQVAALREEQKILLKAVRSLRLDLQIVVELFYWEELKVQEISDLLGVPPGTVKWRLSRARELLRERILGDNPAGVVECSTVTNFERWVRSLHEEVGIVGAALRES